MPDPLAHLLLPCKVDMEFSISRGYSYKGNVTLSSLSKYLCEAMSIMAHITYIPPTENKLHAMKTLKL